MSRHIQLGTKTKQLNPTVTSVVASLIIALLMAGEIPTTVMRGLTEILPFLPSKSFISGPLPLLIALYVLIPATTSGIVLMSLRAHRPFSTASVVTVLTLLIAFLLGSSLGIDGFIDYFVLYFLVAFLVFLALRWKIEAIKRTGST